MSALLFILFSTPPSLIPEVECSHICLNHVYRKEGAGYEHQLSQIIFFSLDEEKGIYAARQWKILYEKDLASFRIEKRDGNFYYMYTDPDDTCFVKAPHFSIIFSRYDLEHQGRTLYKDYTKERDKGITPRKRQDYLERIKAERAADRD